MKPSKITVEVEVKVKKIVFALNEKESPVDDDSNSFDEVKISELVTAGIIEAAK